MKRPSFQFYPGDWQANSNLRRCTHAEKGVWIDVMCLMHDQNEYGILRWPLKEIAQAVGCQLSALKSLVFKEVMKGCESGPCESFIYIPRSGRKEGDPVTLVQSQEGPIWYSSRMVRDEYVRTIRGESSRFSANKDDTPKDSPKPPLGDGSSSPSSSSSSDGSDTNVSGNELPKDEVWTLGVDLLVQAKIPERQARSFIGKLCKDYGTDKVLEAVHAANKARPVNPGPYMEKVCQNNAKTKAKTIAEKDFSVGVKEDGTIEF